MEKTTDYHNKIPLWRARTGNIIRNGATYAVRKMILSGGAHSPYDIQNCAEKGRAMFANQSLYDWLIIAPINTFDPNDYETPADLLEDIAIYADNNVTGWEDFISFFKNSQSVLAQFFNGTEWEVYPANGNVMAGTAILYLEGTRLTNFASFVRWLNSQLEDIFENTSLEEYIDSEGHFCFGLRRPGGTTSDTKCTFVF